MANVFGLLPAAIGVVLIRRLELTLSATHAGFYCRAALSHNVLSF